MVIIGGGVSGVETALTLASLLVEADVRLIADSHCLRMLPNLMHVALGDRPKGIEIPLASLVDYGVTFIEAHVDEVDTQAKRLKLSGARSLDYDILILASGVQALPTPGHRLRTLADALAVQAGLLDLAGRTGRTEVLVRIMDESDWSAPAYEFAFLLDSWLRAQGLRERIAVTIATSEWTPFSSFGYEASCTLQDALADRKILLLSGVQPLRVEDMEADMVVDFGYLEAPQIKGLQRGVEHERFYDVDPSGCLSEHSRYADNIYVVGDGASHGLKGAFVAPVEAMRIARKLGAPGLPDHDDCEYQCDFAGQVMIVRMSTRPQGQLTLGAIGLRPSIELAQGYPVKLKGLRVRQLIADSDPRLTPSAAFLHKLAAQPLPSQNSDDSAAVPK